jgi:hypothetical protein
MNRNLFLTIFGCLYSLNISAATFYKINTTSPLYCHLSSKFQNRIMIEDGRIKKVVATESERLSIQIEEITGQAFIYARDPSAKEISISVVSDTGVVQDILICFIERSPEVIVLEDPETKECLPSLFPTEQVVEKSFVLTRVEEILEGKIPIDYTFCKVKPSKWIPKKGIEMQLKSRLDGPIDDIYIYEATNTLKQEQTLLECELDCEGCSWVYLERNTLNPKQKILGIVTVKKL